MWALGAETQGEVLVVRAVGRLGGMIIGSVVLFRWWTLIEVLGRRWYSVCRV